MNSWSLATSQYPWHFVPVDIAIGEMADFFCAHRVISFPFEFVDEGFRPFAFRAVSNLDNYGLIEKVLFLRGMYSVEVPLS